MSLEPQLPHRLSKVRVCAGAHLTMVSIWSSLSSCPRNSATRRTSRSGPCFKSSYFNTSTLSCFYNTRFWFLYCCKFYLVCCGNKKQCSRQLQCEVPCGIGDVNSALSSLPSTSHARPHRGVWQFLGGLGEGGWGRGVGGGEGGWGRGRGQGTFHPLCHILHDHKVLRPKGTSHNNCRAHITRRHIPIKIRQIHICSLKT